MAHQDEGPWRHMMPQSAKTENRRSKTGIAMSPRRGMLFSAFEPSGDELAAPVIRRLRDTHPDLHLWALGGPRMQQAGAEMI